MRITRACVYSIERVFSRWMEDEDALWNTLAGPVNSNKEGWGGQLFLEQTHPSQTARSLAHTDALVGAR